MFRFKRNTLKFFLESGISVMMKFQRLLGIRGYKHEIISVLFSKKTHLKTNKTKKHKVMIYYYHNPTTVKIF